MNLEKIGKFLAQLRKEQNITQEELADKIGVSAKTVSKWERGKNFPDTIWLCKLSEIFNVGVEDIVNGERIDTTKKEGKVPAYFIKLNKNKSKKKILFLLMIILVIFALLFSAVYTITNYNRNKIFSLSTEDDSFKIDGYIIYNQREKLIILNDIKFEDTVAGTDLEPIIKSYEITLKSNKHTLYSKTFNIETEETLSKALKTAKISFSEVNKETITDSEIQKLYIMVDYIDRNGDLQQNTIKVKSTEEYASNKIFY